MLAGHREAADVQHDLAGWAGALLTRSCTARPTISAASSASVAVGGRSTDSPGRAG